MKMKLEVKVSSQFHHLMNTVLTLGSLVVKWLPITVAHTCKLDNLNDILLTNWNWLHPIAITSSGVGYFTELIGAHALKTYFVPALEVDYVEKHVLLVC